MNAAESNPEEYASDRITDGAENITHEAGHQAKSLGQKGLREVRERIFRGRNNVEPDNLASEPPGEQPRQDAQKERIKTREAEARKTENGRDVPRQPTPQDRATQARDNRRIPARQDNKTESVERPSDKSAVEKGRKRVIQNAQKQRTETSARLRSGERQLAHSAEPAKKSVKATARSTKKSIKETARSTGKKTIKTVEKTTARSVKTAEKSVKTAERTAKTSIKTTKEAAKIAEKSAQAAAKAAQKAAQVARATAKAVAAGVKAAVKATIAAVKAIIAATKALISAIAAGGWVAVLVIVIIMLVALVACSVFGIFFSGEDSGTGMTMQNAVQEINANYDSRLEAEKASVSYDVLEMSGSRAVWKEVLAVYSVKINTDPDDPQEVATVDDTKIQLLSGIFWEMNAISSHTETSSTTVTTETDDGEGNIVTTETTETITTLYIVVTHKTVDEMADYYGFDQEQRDYLAELLADENNSLWAAVLYGIGYSDDEIVTVALSQIGNVGGMPYWSWYGFDSRVEWCACFVSWCANECGYIETGVIPKYAGCSLGMEWFEARGQWADNSAEPVSGMIIFFDWDDENGQDGVPDHTGIVEKVENGVVYTVEGNSGDSVRINSYPVGYYEILGYGVPMY